MVISTDPLNHEGITTQISTATITFDTAMLRSGVSDPRSVTDPANYQITDMATGQNVKVAAAIYNPDQRSVQLVFDTLAPSTYELRVLPAVQDQDGNTLASSYSGDFSIVQDLTAGLGSSVEFANTRIDRGAGTVSVDVRLTNGEQQNLSGPIRVLFTGLAKQGLTLRNGTGTDAAGTPFVDLIPTSGTLALRGRNRLGHDHSGGFSGR